jgi:hypothetical protein
MKELGTNTILYFWIRSKAYGIKKIKSSRICLQDKAI